jgi:hypothetical protein
MVNRFSPMREVLGELLLKADKPAEAQCEFEQSLKAVPNRFRSLAGPGGGGCPGEESSRSSLALPSIVDPDATRR